MIDAATSLYDAYSGEFNCQFIEQLIEDFESSPEAQPVIEQFGRGGWVGLMLEFAGSYIGTTVAAMSLGAFREIVFELFPQKVSTEAESAASIIAELRAFWTYAHRQYQPPNAKRIADSLTDDSVTRLQEELSNPANFGMAKSFVMQGQMAGHDMTTQAGVDAFMAEFNRRIQATADLGGLPPLSSLVDPDMGLPPPTSHWSSGRDREKKRKARKAQKESRKRNRRK